MKLSIPRISQILFFSAFLLLFVSTEYRGKDEISYAVNSFFRMDPLVALSYFIANFSFNVILLPGLITGFFSVFLGRFFCGWVCPLGFVLDIVGKK